MTDDEVKDLVGCYVKDAQEAELTVRAVKFVTSRMNLAKRVCDKLFGEEMAEVEEVYTMYDYLNRETSTQLLLMTGEKAVAQLDAAKARTKPDGELN